MASSPGGNLLEMRGISKGFPGVQALDAVDFTVRRAEIHGLMGENGAGKSTLIKVLTGVYPRDAGEVTLAGLPIHPRSPKAAEALGVSTVYQEINLIPHLSVAENICLGRQPTTRLGTIRWRAIARRAREALQRVDLDLDVGRSLSSCSIAIQQMVAIARALDVSAELLVLDEPTSSLDEGEVAELFAVMRKLGTEGLGIIFITHFLDQVYEITDRITVLRDGRLVGEYRTAELPRLELVSRMIGKDVDQVQAIEQARPPGRPDREAPPRVRVRGISRKGSLAPIDLDLHPGRVLGLAGLLGSGRTETARLLFGIDTPTTGKILVDGRRLDDSLGWAHRLLAGLAEAARSVLPRWLGWMAWPLAAMGRAVARSRIRAAIRQGFAFTPEDRRVAGIIPHLSVRENIVLALQGRQGLWRAMSRRRQNRIAEEFIAALGIKTPSAEQAIGNLSGGNQQKALLARWLAVQPAVLILDEPTRGIDVGAKAEIEKLVADLCDRGVAVLFISSELEEVVRASHRVAVLRDRAKVAELTGDEIDEQTIMHTIAGSRDG